MAKNETYCHHAEQGIELYDFQTHATSCHKLSYILFENNPAIYENNDSFSEYTDDVNEKINITEFTDDFGDDNNEIKFDINEIVKVDHFVYNENNYMKLLWRKFLNN